MLLTDLLRRHALGNNAWCVVQKSCDYFFTQYEEWEKVKAWRAACRIKDAAFFVTDAQADVDLHYCVVGQPVSVCFKDLIN